MDRDRVEGAARRKGGALKKAAGRALGDRKLEAEGRADRAAGKVQNAIGGVKDALREGRSRPRSTARATRTRH
jgi:uncharacterized protein YjbJ (UPF0337 family)